MTNNSSYIEYVDIIKNNPNSIVKINEWDNIKHDIFICYELIKSTKFTKLNHIPKEMFNNFNISLALFYNSKPKIKYIPETLLRNHNFIISVLELNYHNISHLPKKYLNNHIIEWFCLKYPNHSPLSFLDLKYKNNLNLVTKLINLNKLNYKDISVNLKNNIDIFNLSLTDSNMEDIFKTAGDNIINNESICLSIIEQKLNLFKFAGKQLKNSESFFLNAIEKNLNILEFSNLIIKDSNLCVTESYLKFPESIKYASGRLLSSPDFLNSLYSKDDTGFEHSFEFWDKTIYNNLDICNQHIEKIIKYNFLSLLSENIRNNYLFMMKAAEIDIKSLTMLGKKLQLSSDFFIELYNIKDNKNRKSGRFNVDSEQSIVFNYISPQAANDLIFIINLYNELPHIFYPIIFHKIKNHGGDLIENIEEQKNLGVENIIEKIELNYKLNHTLPLFDKKHINKI